jgi:catechol 2,3-dioxygenase-like lactoylglutathione lyase family enzyme
MKLDAISVTSTDLEKTVRFYSVLGFVFRPCEKDERHIEPQTKPGDVRLMIDTADLIESITGSKPTPPNHSSFAMTCDYPSDVDAACEKIKAEGFVVTKEPWDAFWGQRYAIVQDPDGYMIDLFAPLEGNTQ